MLVMLFMVSAGDSVDSPTDRPIAYNTDYVLSFSHGHPSTARQHHRRLVCGWCCQVVVLCCHAKIFPFLKYVISLCMLSFDIASPFSETACQIFKHFRIFHRFLSIGQKESAQLGLTRIERHIVCCSFRW